MYTTTICRWRCKTTKLHLRTGMLISPIIFLTAPTLLGQFGCHINAMNSDCFHDVLNNSMLSHWLTCRLHANEMSSSFLFFVLFCFLFIFFFIFISYTLDFSFLCFQFLFSSSPFSDYSFVQFFLFIFFLSLFLLFFSPLSIFIFFLFFLILFDGCEYHEYH